VSDEETTLPDRVRDKSSPRAVLRRLMRERTAMARVDGSLHDLFPVAIEAAEGEALREWVSRERASHTIEVGLGYGIAALFICEGLLANGGSGASHIAIDPFQRTRFSDCGLQFLEEAGVAAMVEHIPNPPRLHFPAFLPKGAPVTLASSTGTIVSTGSSSTSCISAG
jgi:hypothetical protein